MTAVSPHIYDISNPAFDPHILFKDFINSMQKLPFFNVESLCDFIDSPAPYHQIGIWRKRDQFYWDCYLVFETWVLLGYFHKCNKLSRGDDQIYQLIDLGAKQ